MELKPPWQETPEPRTEWGVAPKIRTQGAARLLASNFERLPVEDRVRRNPFAVFGPRK
jgi:hypothetical protein